MFSEPSFLIQSGYQARKRIKKAVGGNYVDGVVLSPSDYVLEANKGLANDLRSNNLVTLFDPQLYLPDQGDRPKLNEYDYHDQYGGEAWDSSIVNDPDELDDFFSSLVTLQDDELSCSGYISPAPYMPSLSEDEIQYWKLISEKFIKKVGEDGEDKPLYITIAVSGDQLTNSSMRSQLLDAATGLDVDGFYVSVMYENDERLPLQGLDNVKSYLELMMKLKANRYEVIAAYTHQISHLLYAVNVDAVASGHFKNLRAFDVDRWIVPDDPPPRRRVVRYYSDNLLCSLRPDGLLNELDVDSEFDVSDLRNSSPYEEDLFGASVDIEAAGWSYNDGSWEHYLWSCHNIAEQYRGQSIDDRTEYARDKVRRGKALQRQINAVIEGNTDEINPDFYDDWDAALSYIESMQEFERVRR